MRMQSARRTLALSLVVPALGACTRGATLPNGGDCPGDGWMLHTQVVGSGTVAATGEADGGFSGASCTFSASPGDPTPRTCPPTSGLTDVFIAQPDGQRTYVHLTPTPAPGWVIPKWSAQDIVPGDAGVGPPFDLVTDPDRSAEVDGAPCSHILVTATFVTALNVTVDGAGEVDVSGGGSASCVGTGASACDAGGAPATTCSVPATGFVQLTARWGRPAAGTSTTGSAAGRAPRRRSRRSRSSRCSAARPSSCRTLPAPTRASERV